MTVSITDPRTIHSRTLVAVVGQHIVREEYQIEPDLYTWRLLRNDSEVEVKYCTSNPRITRCIHCNVTRPAYSDRYQGIMGDLCSSGPNLLLEVGYERKHTTRGR